MTKKTYYGHRETLEAEGKLTKQEFNDVFKLLKMFCGKTKIGTEEFKRFDITIYDEEMDREFSFTYDPRFVKSKHLRIDTTVSGPIGLDDFVAERNGNL